MPWTALLLAGLLAQEPDPKPDTARWETYRSLRADLKAERHASDGGGRARLVEEPEETVRAGERGTWSFRYEAGEHGIAEGGTLFLQVSPFWGWSTPQVHDPLGAGFTLVRCEASGVTLEPETVDQQLLAIRVTGRALQEGETVEVVYGAGGAGAVADRFAESGSPFWFAVDGDGDGVRGLVPDPPRVAVAPNEAAQILLLLPTTARAGETVRLTVAVLDALGNAGVPFRGTVTLDGPLAGLGLEEPEVAFDGGEGGLRHLELEAAVSGIYQLTASGADGLEGRSNPLLVRDAAPRILWGDLQVHTALSDGTGTLEEVMRYARDVAALDLVALTDHDHWGFRFLDARQEDWVRVQEVTRAFHEPGRFVTLLGYEWTNWVHGHRHVLYFGDEGPLLSSMDERYDTPAELWRALEGHDAMTIAHHSAGAPVPVNWSYAPPPAIEPLTEVVSVHGSSEAGDSPGRVRGAVPGNFVRDQLDAGLRLGLIGSGDGHDGHPGLAHLASRSGGLVAIQAEERTREGVAEALRARRVYATNGPRILLRFRVAGRLMGSVLHAADHAEGAPFVARVIAESAVRRMDLIRSGDVVLSVDTVGRSVFFYEETLSDLEPGEYVYVRVVQEDGGAAWSSPIWFD